MNFLNRFAVALAAAILIFVAVAGIGLSMLIESGVNALFGVG